MSEQAFTWSEYYNKMDYEGGVVEFLRWGGVDCFPDELQELAATLRDVLDAIEEVSERHPYSPEDDPDYFPEGGEYFPEDGGEITWI